MADLNVTYEEMRAAAKNLTDGQANVETTLAGLKSGIDGLVQSGYVTGKSSPAFQAAYELFDKGTRETIAGLTGMASFLTAAAQAMEDTDSQLASQLA